jgi:hypothetical protein
LIKSDTGRIPIKKKEINDSLKMKFNKKLFVLVMADQKVLVKLYGESFKVHVLNIKSHFLKLEHFHHRASQLGEPLETALLNINFFKDFSTRELNCVQDIIEYTFGGLINNSKAKIEIKKGRKLLQKFSLDDLFYPKTLFPLFNTHKGTITLKLKNNIFLLENEVGLIGQYEIETQKFDIEKLKFNIANVKYLEGNYQLLLAISYSKDKLETIKSDSLVTHQHIVSLLN